MIGTLITSFGVICSVAAGASPVSEPTSTFKFELEGTAGGKPFSFQQYYSCYQTRELSASDGKFHQRWSASGSGTQVGQVNEDLFIIYNVQGCNPTASQKSVIAAVDSVANPTFLYLFRVQTTEPLFFITKDQSMLVSSSGVSIGATPAQVQLKETLRESQSGFQRVTARVVPYEVFATSDQARAYFAALNGIVVAEQPGRVADELVFPFFSQRDFSKLRTTSEYMNERALMFNGEEFIFESTSPKGEVFYSTPETRNWKTPWFRPTAKIRYKTMRFDVQTFQEIYDPELRAIIVFYNQRRAYPWPSPEVEDLIRLEKRKTE